jgi:lipoprotein-releasing system ATP-binding protein
MNNINQKSNSKNQTFNDDSIILTRDLHKSYLTNGEELEVLKGLDLEIKRGEIMAIVGPSGAGKSTLLHILGALDRPSRGQVIFNRQDINHLSDDELSVWRNLKAGFVFQFHHLLPEFTALENVSIPGFMHLKNDKNNLNRNDITAKAFNILKEIGLEKRINHLPAQLSGGEQQRVAVARALINDPEVLLADEPTGNLDGKNSQMVGELLLNLNRDKKQTIIIVTHNENLAEKAHRKIHLVDGVIKDY